MVVAEINFNRDASPEEFRQLGKLLEACCRSHGWIAHITGLDDLLRGECPQQFSKAIANQSTGAVIPVSYDPILVWGRLDYPHREKINPIAILSATIPPSLGRVTYPDPDGGL